MTCKEYFNLKMKMRREKKVIYIICGVPCIEVCCESDHKKSFYFAGRYFVKLSDYYNMEDDNVESYVTAY